jgi:hypothetical protein
VSSIFFADAMVGGVESVTPATHHRQGYAYAISSLVDGPGLVSLSGMLSWYIFRSLGVLAPVIHAVVRDGCVYGCREERALFQ